ncbi:hypothetical protein SSS_05652 [Sarcoptes scabiei]|uniref:Major facilitator superfamily associated domain-containing protein n=1 Tax=Sarcoptes scabiei TaxID=52283 RepID=A0A834RDR6_SARSC|nr:hypothetical protein SSS_05652 [Sarcoptes scabiei]
MSLIVSPKKYLFSSQNFINFAFYSALASLLPFLNIHLIELGLTWSECTWINLLSGLISMLGPLVLGPLAHKLSGYKQTLVLTLVLAFLSVTALLFIPGVISTEHIPKIYFDCNEGVLRIEQCPNWSGECQTYPQRSMANFSSFEIVTCSYHCVDDKTAINSSWYPISVCFHNNNDPVSLCLDAQKEKIISKESSLTPEVSIQFDSRFDRWPIIEPNHDLISERVFDGRQTCVFKPSPPLLMLQNVYSNIQCRPYVPYCSIYCSINLGHRSSVIGSKSSRIRSPTFCHLIEGNPKQTFYLYLLFRCLVDLTLLTADGLIEALRIANTNNYDSIYAGIESFWTIIVPFVVWPPFCGLLSDYFGQIEVHNYAPSIIIFDGFVAIAIFLIVLLPLNSTRTTDLPKFRQRKLQPTNFRYPRTHSNQYLLYRLSIFIPLVLILGLFWGLSETLVRPFYRIALQSSNFWIGSMYGLSFLAAALFAYKAKSLINGIGRMHLIILSFLFYALKHAGTSFIVSRRQQTAWLLIPFEMMAAFCLPLCWIGIVSYGQHLIKRSPNALSYATGSTIFQTYSPHIIMQYTLILMHFGGGRALGSGLLNIWLNLWPSFYKNWIWLSDFDRKNMENFPTDSLLNEETAARVLLRLSAILSLIFCIFFVFLYHSCCLNFIIERRNRSAATPMISNFSKEKNSNYLKLKSRSENEVYPLRSSGSSVKKKSNENQNHFRKEPITRSMITLRENLESSIDGDDDN